MQRKLACTCTTGPAPGKELPHPSYPRIKAPPPPLPLALRVAHLQDPHEEPLVPVVDLEPHAAGHPDGRRADEGGLLRPRVDAAAAEGARHGAAAFAAAYAWLLIGAAHFQVGVRCERDVGEREGVQHGLVDLAPAHPQVEDSKGEARRRLRHGHGSSFRLGNVTHVQRISHKTMGLDVVSEQSGIGHHRVFHLHQKIATVRLAG